MQETILQSVGRTPLVQLRRVSEGLQARVYVKLESLNPGGSVKDRVGVAMITSAPEALALHERMSQELWQRALKGVSLSGSAGRIASRPWSTAH